MEIQEAESDEMPGFPRKTRPAAGERFFDSDSLSGTNGHQTDTKRKPASPPSRFSRGAGCSIRGTQTAANFFSEVLKKPQPRHSESVSGGAPFQG